MTAFKPCGVPGRLLEAVELRLDELEAVRLADLDGLYQDAAAERMGVSRATFGRLVESGRHKIASALLGGKMLMFKGGPVMLRDMRTFRCADCGAQFQVAFGAARPAGCPSCQSKNFHREEEEERGGHRGRGRGGRGCCRRHRHRRGASQIVESVVTKEENAE